MRIAFRAVALLVACSTLPAGPLADLALAQPASQPAKPEILPETLKPSDQPVRRRIDAYDVGAVAANVVAIPGKIALCGIAGAFALGIFAVTFGMSYKASTKIATEGCGGNWILTGDDLRPEEPELKPFDWEKTRK
jgi:hypothetical protein